MPDDKTVPADANDYRQPEEATTPDDGTRSVRHHPLEHEARQRPGEPPNRDQDEFDRDGLRTPRVDPELQEERDDT